jgi:hypothetical protein
MLPKGSAWLFHYWRLVKKRSRAMYHRLSRIKSGGGAGYFLSGAGLIACKDVGGLEAFSGLWHHLRPFTHCEKLSGVCYRQQCRISLNTSSVQSGELRRQGGSTSG